MKAIFIITKFIVLLSIFAILLIGCATVKGDFAIAKNTDTSEAYQWFLEAHPDSPLTDEARKAILICDWKKAQELNTKEGYLAFKLKHPGTSFEEQVSKALDDIAWSESCDLNTTIGYRNYLEKKPMGLHRLECQQALEALCEKDWQGALSKNTKADYENHVRQWPTSPHAGEIAAKLKLISENVDFEQAKLDNTVTAYQLFMGKWPLSTYRSKIDEFIIDLDNSSWDKAMAEGKTTDYEGYLKEWTQGRHITEARDSIAQLAENYNKMLAIEKIEKQLVEKIKKNGATGRYIAPLAIIDMKKGAFCVISYSKSQDSKNNKGSTGYSIASSQSSSSSPDAINCECRYPNDSLISTVTDLFPNFFGGEEEKKVEKVEDEYSIQRVIGTVDFGGIKSISDGDMYNLLTFVLIKGEYIYLRGKGKVIDDTGKTISLGY